MTPGDALPPNAPMLSMRTVPALIVMLPVSVPTPATPYVPASDFQQGDYEPAKPPISRSVVVSDVVARLRVTMCRRTAPPWSNSRWRCQSKPALNPAAVSGAGFNDAGRDRRRVGDACEGIRRGHDEPAASTFALPTGSADRAACKGQCAAIVDGDRVRRSGPSLNGHDRAIGGIVEGYVVTCPLDTEYDGRHRAIQPIGCRRIPCAAVGVSR